MLSLKSTLCLMLACCTAALGADPHAVETGPNEPRRYRMEVSPARPPTPPLRYQLRPRPLEIEPGDAAPIYMALSPRLENADLDDLRDVPTGQLPRSGAARRLAELEPLFAGLDKAARMSRAEWPGRTDVEAGSSHLSPMRHAVNLLHLRTRLAIAEKRYDDAIHSMQSGFALADHVAHDGPLVDGLVCIGMVMLNAQGVRELQSQPDGPNLYWALSALPRPLVDTRALLEGERRWIVQREPALRLKREQITAETWAVLTGQMMKLQWMPGQPDADAEPAELPQQASAGLLAAASIMPARQWLAARGMTQEELAALPPLQIVSIYSIESFQEAFDHLIKWQTLPHGQAYPAILRDRQLQGVLSGEQFSNPLLTPMIPALMRANETVLRVNREVAALQVIEAIRAHAAEHSALPAALDEIADWPPLSDPGTGRAFDYHVDGRQFTLSAPPIDPNRPYAGFIFEVRLRD